MLVNPKEEQVFTILLRDKQTYKKELLKISHKVAVCTNRFQLQHKLPVN